MLRRNRNMKAPLRDVDQEDPQASSNLSSEGQERALGFFYQESDHLQPDLEMPIKIEARNFRRRRQSDSYSEPPVELYKEEEKAFPCQHLESEEMMQVFRQYDPIDELLFPLEHLESPEGGKYQMELEGAQPLPETPLEEDHLAKELEKIPVEEANRDASDERGLHRKTLMWMVNNFQAYNHSLAVAMNFHALLRKDYVTKIYGSILGVLTKESRKMEAILLEELKMTATCAKPQKEVRREQKKDLSRTMIEDEKFMVKEEYIE